MLAGIVPAVVLIFGLLISKRASELSASTDAATATAPLLARPQPRIAPSPAVVRDDGVAIHAADLKAVDPAALIQQAGAEVRKRASNCELTYAYIGVLSGGVLDASGHTSLLRWGCLTIDKSKPPGQDVADDEWDVRVANGKLDLKKSTSGSHNKPPWSEPTCPFSRAWAAAVESGLPASAVVSVYYRYSGKTLGTVWDLTVTGHPELARKMSGATCQIVRH